MIRAGQTVHVRMHDHLGAVCRPAVVIVGGEHDLRVRVMLPSPIVGPVGRDDLEGWYQDRPLTYANPDGTVRDGDTWHALTDCPDGA